MNQYLHLEKYGPNGFNSTMRKQKKTQQLSYADTAHSVREF